VLEGIFAPWHILVIATVALLVLGPDKIPEAARQVGRGILEVRKFRDYLSRDVHEMLNSDEAGVPSGQSSTDEPSQSDDHHR
jgi:TatA/E family protein of Tat protein translocase